MACRCDCPRPEEEAGRLLEGRGLTLALAESCTGGMIAARITDIPGSSAYFTGGVVAYDNRVKKNVLGVPGDQLAGYGAVSEQVARSMAAGVKRLLKADIGLSVTGIAGPGGGTQEKPVGLVYVALDGPAGALCRQLSLGGSRAEIRSATVAAALEMLCLYLLEGQCGQETVDSRQ
ncbi:MAG: nicotinamide-nucleotide amidohydrolase family protein [Peptococcaceae bacterium]|nr:nicotinamide-nucleotide amidohydrolase family protein [Peptococcaceae bacterium]